MSELFIEIRCEELPARFIRPATEALAQGAAALLKGLSHGEVRAWGAPRRLAVAIVDVPETTPSEEKLITGPLASVAMKDGVPTKAGEGFARGKGLDPSALVVVDGPKGPVVAVTVRTGGERVAERVAAGLEALVLGVPFAKSMRWGTGKARWGRPLHGVVCLLGGQPVAASVAGIDTGTTTIGHRLFADPFEINGSASWLAGCRAHRVEPDVTARRASIEAQLAAHAAALGAELRPMPDLLDEVSNLVEWPVVVTSTIQPDLMHLPPRLLVESMKVHQRVFPLFKGSELDNHFLVVSNHPLADDPAVAAIIAEGNARVLASRFHDARHFYAEDRKARLESRWHRLEGMHWIRKGGTMADKSHRLVAIANALAGRFDADAERAARAALLCKCDLATQMVGEFPELQGHVGRLLALHQGEDEHVAMAIEEHYLPRFAGDALPHTAAGRALAVADRLDTLVGCFSLDLRPKGSADPLGLRRAANGLLALLLDAGRRVNLTDLFVDALTVWRGGDPDAPLGPDAARVAEDLVEFTLTRLRAGLMESASTEFVDAVLATTATDPVALKARLDALVALSRTEGFGPLKTTFKRVMGLTRDHEDPGYDPDAFAAPAELALHQALNRVAGRAAALGADLCYDLALDELATLKAPVDQLFDEVLVMADDPGVRANRLGLLRAVADAFGNIADFTHLSAEG